MHFLRLPLHVLLSGTNSIFNRIEHVYKPWYSSAGTEPQEGEPVPQDAGLDKLGQKPEIKTPQRQKT